MILTFKPQISLGILKKSNWIKKGRKIYPIFKLVNIMEIRGCLLQQAIEAMLHQSKRPFLAFSLIQVIVTSS